MLLVFDDEDAIFDTCFIRVANVFRLENPDKTVELFSKFIIKFNKNIKLKLNYLLCFNKQWIKYLTISSTQLSQINSGIS